MSPGPRAPPSAIAYVNLLDFDSRNKSLCFNRSRWCLRCQLFTDSWQGSRLKSTLTGFWITLLDAFYQSLVCFFVPYFTYCGSDIDIFSFGNPINTAALFIMLFHLLIECKSVTWLHTVVIVGSILLYFMFSLAFGATCKTHSLQSDFYWIVEKHMTDPVFYLVCLLTTCIALLPRYLTRVRQGTLFPSPVLRAKYLVILSPKEQRKAIKRWKDECNVDDRVELQPTSVPSNSAAGAVSEEESTDSVLPASKIPFQTCSRDGLVDNTSFLPDIQDESGSTSDLNSEKTEFIKGN